MSSRARAGADVPADAAGYAAALERAAGGHWPGVAARVVAPGSERGAIEPADLERSASLSACLARFDRAHPDDDAPALASLWIQWYAATTWPVLAAGAILVGAGPPLDETAIALDAEARPCGVRMGAAEAVEPAGFLEALARRQAAPLMAAAAARGLAPRVPWSNAINVLGWTLAQLRGVADETRLAAASDLLVRPRWADGSANPLAAGGAFTAGRPARRVCCLRYRLQDFAYCGDCPIPAARRA